LPDNIPPELLKSARRDDDRFVERERRRLLLSYFGGSVETREQAEKLIFELAAVLFPAFGKPPPLTRPGRPKTWRSKYSIEFLNDVAEAFGRTKATVTKNADMPFELIYRKFLKDKAKLAERLRGQGPLAGMMQRRLRCHAPLNDALVSSSSARALEGGPREPFVRRLRLPEIRNEAPAHLDELTALAAVNDHVDDRRRRDVMAPLVGVPRIFTASWTSAHV